MCCVGVTGCTAGNGPVAGAGPGRPPGPLTCPLSSGRAAAWATRPLRGGGRRTLTWPSVAAHVSLRVQVGRRAQWGVVALGLTTWGRTLLSTWLRGGPQPSGCPGAGADGRPQPAEQSTRSQGPGPGWNRLLLPSALQHRKWPRGKARLTWCPGGPRADPQVPRAGWLGGCSTHPCQPGHSQGCSSSPGPAERPWHLGPAPAHPPGTRLLAWGRASGCRWTQQACPSHAKQ